MALTEPVLAGLRPVVGFVGDSTAALHGMTAARRRPHAAAPRLLRRSGCAVCDGPAGVQHAEHENVQQQVER